MHLYLSSFMLGNEADKLASLVHRPTAVVIGNALDHAGSQLRNHYLRASTDALRKLGLSTQELDLRDYFDSRHRLEKACSNVGLVWVNGGNIFLLRRAMRQSGLDRYLTDRRREDQLVYGGYSAGACVVGPTLRGAHLVDAPDADATGYVGVNCLDGLGFVPFCIAPHYKSAHPESSRVDAMVEYFTEHGLPFVALRDGEVVLAVAN